MTQYDHLFTRHVFCNFSDIDAITGGFQCGDLIAIASLPGIDKLTFALNIAYNASEYCPVAFFCLNMPKEQVIIRLLSLESGIESSSLLTRSIWNSQKEALNHAFEKIKKAQIVINDSSDLSDITVVDICNSVRQSKFNNEKIGMVVIDSLDVIKASSNLSKNKEFYRSVRNLKIFAREFNIPVIVLSSVKPEVDNRLNKRPFLSDLPGRIDEIANLVFFLHQDATEISILEVIIAKNQNGPTSVIKLLFEPQFFRLRNLTQY
jgi:replicative DNA helicase